jgi:hypothetical protein
MDVVSRTTVSRDAGANKEFAAMPRRQPTPAEIVARELDAVLAAVRNLLVTNRNMLPSEANPQPFYVREHPQTGAFIRGPLRDMADHILERLQQAKSLAVDMAADPDLPAGMSRSYSGSLHGREVIAAESGGGTWAVRIDVPFAFHAGDDRTATVSSEAGAIALIREFAATGQIPQAMAPADGQGLQPG